MLYKSDHANGKGCIWVSQGCIDFTGAPQEAHLGDGWTQFVDAGAGPQVNKAGMESLDTGKPVLRIYKARRFDGARHWVIDILMSPTKGTNGTIDAICRGAVIDINEEMEFLLNGNQKNRQKIFQAWQPIRVFVASLTIVFLVWLAADEFFEHCLTPAKTSLAITPIHRPK
jgi:hypothetical protein